MAALRSLSDATPRLKELVRKRAIAAAKAARAEVEQRQGAHPTVTVVDGRRNAPEEQVKAFGRITYQIDTVPLAAAYIKKLLMGIAPVDKGNYKKSYRYFANGDVIDDLDTLPAFTHEVIITDTQPYTRLIEGMARRGPRGRMIRRPGLSAQAPNGTLELTAQAVKRRFTRINITFEYRSMPDVAQGMKNGDRWPCIVLRNAL